MRKTLLLAVLSLVLSAAHVATADELADGFQAPPLDTRPGCYWYFFRDDVSKDGITKDLEAMAQVGIGRAYIGYINQGANPPGDNQVLSDKWWERLEHTFVEADRLNIDIGMFNCPGWSQSGGPWIPPECSMRNLVNTELRISGPQEFSGVLPSRDGYFETVKVLAFPAPPQESITMRSYGVEIRVNGQPIDSASVVGANAKGPISALFDDDPKTTYTFPEMVGSNRPLVIDLHFERAFPVQSVIAQPVEERTGIFGSLLASDDGSTYRKLIDLDLYHGHQVRNSQIPSRQACPPLRPSSFALN